MQLIFAMSNLSYIYCFEQDMFIFKRGFDGNFNVIVSRKFSLFLNY
jgi:hypothetical protein